MKLEHFAETDKRQPVALPHFPTRLQAVVWRNWGLVPADRLARVLKAAPGELADVAAGLGLPAAEEADPVWLTRGYITILRANWHLLPYGQLLELLDWSEEQLAFALQEDDFLWIKMGSLKPATDPVHYRPLTERELAETERLRLRLSRYFAPPAEREAGEAMDDRPDQRQHRFFYRRSGLGANADGALSLPPLREPAKPFDFLRGFAGGAPAASNGPHVRVTAAADSGESAELRTMLDERFAIVIPSDRPRIRKFAERFARDHERAWGIRLKLVDEAATLTHAAAPSDGGSPVLLLEIGEVPGKLRESHLIEVADSAVRVTAADENGLLRGLQWIAAEMKARGGPHLERGDVRRDTRYDFRLLYSYCAVYGDPLLDPDLDPYPDGLLERLSEVGVNAIWLQCVLYQLVPFAEAPEWSAGWEKRIEGLRRLARRAGDYGIGVYLYFNEPRSMPIEFFEGRPEWRGHTSGPYASMCTSHPEVQRYLKEGTAALFRAAPELTGLYTITMSENLTNCYSKAGNGQTNCPRCSARPEEEVVAEVNRIIAEGARSAKPDADIVCYAWAWRKSLGFTQEKLERCISLLPDGMAVMNVSEDEMPTNVGGVAGHVVDYSISVVGPSERSRRIWEVARSHGLPAVAKVQFNNSWENSAVPYMPVFDLVLEHLDRLNREGVSGLMLSWTLGGYPSPTLELTSQHYFKTERLTASGSGIAPGEEQAGDTGTGPGTSLGAWLAGKFGTRAGAAVERASAMFSRAFRQFPFHISVLYTAPQNYGPANLLYARPTGYSATMIGFPYDDLQRWRAIYPEETFESQFGKLLEGWEEGLDALTEAGPLLDGDASAAAYADLVQVSLGSYYHFLSTYCQIAFVRERDKMADAKEPEVREKSRRRMIELAELELETARHMHALLQRDSRIGYEASNHYYYTSRILQEKVLNCLDVRAGLNGGEPFSE